MTDEDDEKCVGERDAAVRSGWATWSIDHCDINIRPDEVSGTKTELKLNVLFLVLDQFGLVTMETSLVTAEH